MDLLERSLALESNIKRYISNGNIKSYPLIWHEVDSICAELLSVYETKYFDECIEIVKVLARLEEPERIIYDQKKGKVFTGVYPSTDYYLYHHSEKIKNCIRLIATPSSISAPAEYITMEKAEHDFAIKYLNK